MFLGAKPFEEPLECLRFQLIFEVLDYPWVLMTSGKE